MTHLSELMRTAAAEPPPSGIDLDGLIVGEQRRSRRLRWAGGLATGAAVLTAAVAAPVLFGGEPAVLPPLARPSAGATPAAPGPEICPSPSFLVHNPGPQQSPGGSRPTESCAAAVRRLTAELTGALATVAPDVRVTPLESSFFVYNANRVEYEAPLKLAGPKGGGNFLIRIAAPHEHPEREKSQCPEDGRSCSYQATRSGTIVVLVDAGESVQGEAYRRDGTALQLAVNGTDGGDPALDRDQLAAIADDPGLTLFPGR